MKKVLIILSLILLTGCGNKEFKEVYENMNIGDNIESYQLDLRIYGNIDNKTINEMYKIDNYKNQKYKIDTFNLTYYFIDGKMFEEKEVMEEIQYNETNENIFYDTNIILEGLNNITSKKEIENDIEGKELKVYEVKIKDNYIKELLNKLGYTNSYNEASGKVYLENENIYKIIYIIDDLNINGTFFRINGINDINIDVKTNSEI